MRISDWSSDVCSSDLREMRIRGQPVIFDICDNIFEGKKRIDKQARLARLREVLSLSTHIVYSTPVLAAQLECYTSGLPISKWVIPDQIDMPQTGTAAYLNPGERYERSEEHTSELQSLMRNSYAVFCLKK